ncbi:RNA polymerase-binding protein DksA [Methylibium sp. Pch-M]|uniref:RNA polymerase-binding protein DksA n=1 Tax=Methylibium sp. Pch-M TaxID=2082386 RepID=UPI001012544A|nr:RNA polymerase-binding protein DksA [Methylibium sp. Pch-M]QAZ39158.1 RNA polymerase-binding protein DksA [Methylibium sp. Pch-M]
MSKTPAKAAPRPTAKKAAASPPAKKGAATKTPTKAAVKRPPAKPAAKQAPKKAAAPAAAAKTPKRAPAPPPPAVKAPAKPAAPLLDKKATPPSVSQSIPPKAPPPPAPAKPATRLRASKSVAAPADIHPPSIPLPPPSRPPASNVIDLPRPPRKIDPKLANVWKTKAGRDLTEDELLSMPDSEYMNDKQLEFFRTRLMQQRNDLLDNAGETTEHLREDTSIVPDPADRATIEEEHALELRTRDRERKLLKKISQSIARIEAGDYGFCDETGEPIGLGRLLARPTATLSLEAQQRREMKQKMFGD